MTRVRGLAARVEAKLGGLARGLRERTVALTTALRDGARRESRRRRLLWLAVAAVLVVGPLAFNLAREPGFEASVALFPQPVPPYPAVHDPRYYEALLRDPELNRQMALNVGPGSVDSDKITFRRGPGILRVTLTVEAGTPGDAQRIVNALAPQIAGATRRVLGFRAARDRERLRERFVTLEPGAERLRVRRRLRRLARFGEFPPTRVLPGAAAPRPTLDRWADRVVDDLPGDFRQRPSPWWAALAGLLVAVTLWAIGLVLFPPRRP